MPCIASFLSISDPTASPRLFNPIASYTMGTDPTALGGNARGDVTQFRDTFQPTPSMFQPNYPLVPTDRERVRAWAYPTSYNTNYTRGHPARPARAQRRDIGRRTRCPLVPRADRGDALGIGPTLGPLGE